MVFIPYFTVTHAITITNIPREKKSLLSISFLAAIIAFFTANNTEQLVHMGGSPIAIDEI